MGNRGNFLLMLFFTSVSFACLYTTWGEKVAPMFVGASTFLTGLTVAFLVDVATENKNS